MDEERRGGGRMDACLERFSPSLPTSAGKNCGKQNQCWEQNWIKNLKSVSTCFAGDRSTTRPVNAFVSFFVAAAFTFACSPPRSFSNWDAVKSIEPWVMEVIKLAKKMKQENKLVRATHSRSSCAQETNRALWDLVPASVSNMISYTWIFSVDNQLPMIRYTFCRRSHITPINSKYLQGEKSRPINIFILERFFVFIALFAKTTAQSLDWDAMSDHRC